LRARSLRTAPRPGKPAAGAARPTFAACVSPGRSCPANQRCGASPTDAAVKSDAELARDRPTCASPTIRAAPHHLARRKTELRQPLRRLREAARLRRVPGGSGLPEQRHLLQAARLHSQVWILGAGHCGGSISCPTVRLIEGGIVTTDRTKTFPFASKVPGTAGPATSSASWRVWPSSNPVRLRFGPAAGDSVRTDGRRSCRWNAGRADRNGRGGSGSGA